MCSEVTLVCAVAMQTSRIIAKLACWSKELMDVRDRQFYLNWLKDQLKIPVRCPPLTPANDS